MNLLEISMGKKLIINEIVEYNNSITTIDLKCLFNSKSFPEIMSSHRDEKVHNSFLSWFFNPDSEHGLFFFPIEKLLQLYAIRCKDDFLITNLYGFFDSLVIGDFKVDEVFIRKDKSQGDAGRPDIFIESKVSFAEIQKDINIVIENKVRSNESPEQTTKYYNYCENTSRKGAINLYFYLTPISTIEVDKLEKPECSCEKFIQINYQLLVDYLLEPALSLSIPNRIRFIIEEYLKSLSRPVELDNKIKKSVIMAITNSERELLRKFWEHNKDLILKAINAISEDEHQEPGVRDAAEKAKIAFDDRSEKVGAYVKRTLKNIIAEKGIKEEEVELMQTKKYSKDSFGIQFPLLVPANGSSPLHYWRDKVVICEKEYYLCCEWFEQINNNDREYFDKWLSKRD